jgi:hypothetical protein
VTASSDDQHVIDDAADEIDDAADPIDRSHRLDTLIHNVELADLKKFLPDDMLSHLNPTTIHRVTVLIDYTFTHPGAHLHDTANRHAQMSDPELMGNCAVAGKNKKYLARASKEGYVLIPFHVNVFGRIHPLAHKLLEFVCNRATAKAQETPKSSVLDGMGPDARRTLHKRSLLRTLSISVQRALTLGMLHAAQRIVRPVDPSSSHSKTGRLYSPLV